MIFQIFQTFGNLEIYLGIDLKYASDKLSILSDLRYIFVKNFPHYKIDLKHTVRMPSNEGYSLTCTYGCMKFYRPKVKVS